ncbi:MAG: SMI1/KNR4 family protein [bacterium]
MLQKQSIDNQSNIFQEFVANFDVRDLAEKKLPDEKDLKTVEEKFRITLPFSYRSFVLEHGMVYTPNLLDFVINNHNILPDVQEFLDTAELILSNEIYWQRGMDKNYFGFAADCMGNLICFNIEDLRCPSPPDAPIYFFDHVFITTKLIADSFLSWLYALNQLRLQ